MIMARAASAASLALSAASLPAWSAYGQIDSFGASATAIQAGATVDFTISYTVITSGYQYGGSNLLPPDPAEGYQTWDLNWYTTESEMLSSVWLNAAGAFWSESPAASPNSAYSGTATLSTLFALPGTYVIAAGGGWEHSVVFYTSNESANRDCMNVDPEGTNELQCSSWTYSYNDWGDNYTSGGSFAEQAITITVSAVPEPAALTLWTTGLLVAGAAAHRRRRGHPPRR